MLIENMMYFALGALVAGLLALIILPAVWKRAVRLTKRRIEAATPITMAEFRADKDQLRAEFALTTRKLEMTVEQLRARLAEQLGEVNQKRADFAVFKAERDQAVGVVEGLEAREAELRGRVNELEREAADLAQRLRKRERDLEARDAELASLREDARGGVRVLEARGDEPGHDENAGQASTPIASSEALSAAEARITGAEQRLTALLQTPGNKSGDGKSLLADELGEEDQIRALQKQVLGVERIILSGTGETEQDVLRRQLEDIASRVSKLVYAADEDEPAHPAPEESLFDRIQRYADRDEGGDPALAKGAVSDRMVALREIQAR